MVSLKMRLSHLTVLALLLTITQAGCVKWYCCGNPSKGFQCVKGNDIISVTVTSEPATFSQTVTDTLNLYDSMGYTCSLIYSGPFLVGECTRGTYEKNNAEAAGKVCINSDLCSGEEYCSSY